MHGLGRGVWDAALARRSIAAQPVAWVNSTNTTVTDQGGGFYRITKTGGSNGASDAFAKTASAKTGDFTLSMRRAVEITSELTCGVNDAPNNTLASQEIFLDFGSGGDMYSWELGITSAQPHGATTTSDTWIFQRVGSTISLYKNTTDSALRTWPNTTAFYGEVLILTVGESIDVKMV